MGEIADSMINGEFDSVTGEYIGEPCGYPRTLTEQHTLTLSKKKQNKIKSIKKEIDIRTESLKAEGVKPEHALNTSRAEANKKYGKGWRNGQFINQSK